MPTDRNQKKQEMRRKSMLGTALFVLAIIGAVLSLVMSSVWIAAAAVVCLVPSIVMLYQVGSSL